MSNKKIKVEETQINVRVPKNVAPALSQLINFLNSTLHSSPENIRVKYEELADLAIKESQFFKTTLSDDMVSARTIIEKYIIQVEPELQETGIKFFNDVKNKMDRRYFLILDKSISMLGPRWEELRTVITFLAPCVCQADPKNGITLFLFSDAKDKHPVYEGIKDSTAVIEIFNKEHPRGNTDLAGVLKQAFARHFSENNEATTILVVTDGQPDNAELVRQEIIGVTEKVKSKDELSISFIQIGDDKKASLFLEELNSNLKGAKYDIVDALSANEMKGLGFEEMVRRSVEQNDF